MKSLQLALILLFAVPALAQVNHSTQTVKGNCNATASGINIKVEVHCGDGLSQADAQKLTDQYVELAKGINKGNVTAAVLSGKLDSVKKELDQLRAAQTAPPQPVCSGNVLKPSTAIFLPLPGS
jgi:hypothetical protein